MSAAWQVAARSLIAATVARLIESRGIRWTWSDVAEEIGRSGESGRATDSIRISALALIAERVKGSGA